MSADATRDTAYTCKEIDIRLHPLTSATLDMCVMSLHLRSTNIGQNVLKTKQIISMRRGMTPFRGGQFFQHFIYTPYILPLY